MDPEQKLIQCIRLCHFFFLIGLCAVAPLTFHMLSGIIAGGTTAPFSGFLLKKLQFPLTFSQITCMEGTVWILCSASGEILHFHKSVCLFFDQPQHPWYGDRILRTFLRTSAKITDRLEVYPTHKRHMLQSKIQNIPCLHIIYSGCNDRHQSNSKFCL